jgi:tetratricopeptide (TPR) repeat protein
MTQPLTKRLAMFAAASALTFSLGMPVFAAGSDSGSQPDASDSSKETVSQCKEGKVYDEHKKKCVEPQKSGFNDTQLFEAARQLAYAGQYDNAIKVLKAAKNQNDPRILNYMGFANRKAGRVDIAMAYYRKAIAIDGNYLLARSYMGQGMILQGDLEGARTQLVEIRDRGGKDTYAYRSLYEALKRGSTY